MNKYFHFSLFSPQHYSLLMVGKRLMAPFLGYFALWLSLSFAILQFLSSFKKDAIAIPQFHKIAVIGLLLSTLFSFFFSHVQSYRF